MTSGPATALVTGPRPAAASAPVGRATDDDAAEAPDGLDLLIAEYGYVWLPYAIAAVVLLALATLVLVRGRSSAKPAITEYLLTRGAVLAVLAATISLLAAAAVGAPGTGLTALDPDVWRWGVANRTAGLTTLATAVTQVGSTVAMTVLCTAGVAVMMLRRQRGQAALIAVVGIGAGLLVRFGKAAVGRERPPLELRLVQETNESFPSGHALASMAVLGVLAFAFAPLIRRRWLRLTTVAIVIAYVCAIGWTRVYLGVHWFTDVLAGWLIGLAWLLLCVTVQRVWRVRRAAGLDPTAPALREPNRERA